MYVKVTVELLAFQQYEELKTPLKNLWKWNATLILFTFSSFWYKNYATIKVLYFDLFWNDKLKLN